MDGNYAVLVPAFLIGTSLLLLSWSLTTTSGEARQQMLSNLQRNLHGIDTGRPNARDERSTLTQVLLGLTPTASVRFLDRLLAGAGRPTAWPIERVVVVKLGIAVIFGGAGMLLIRTQPVAQALLIALLLAVAGWFLPELMLYNSATKRRKAITRSLPDVLDQLTIAVEAGLGFEAALAHVGRNSRGPLGDELIRTLQEIQVGVPRREAYQSLAERAHVDDLKRFVRAILQAEKYGVSVADVLGTQAKEMRLKRRQRAEEAAMKIPVKVVFPLTLFILPTLFIVVLGPAVLSAMAAFSGQ